VEVALRGDGHTNSCADSEVYESSIHGPYWVAPMSLVAAKRQLRSLMYCRSSVSIETEKKDRLWTWSPTDSPAVHP
jgi:hypothetical protein